MFHRLLCTLGFHDWFTTLRVYRCHYQRCGWCPRSRRVERRELA